MNPFRRRPGAVYAIDVEYWSPTLLRWTKTLGYVGKTHQRVGARIEQHRVSQPWSDLIVDHRVLWESNRVTGFGLWWREIWYILTRFPVYNYQWNRLNPRRIPIYRARAERTARRYNGRWTR